MTLLFSGNPSLVRLADLGSCILGGTCEPCCRDEGMPQWGITSSPAYTHGACSIQYHILDDSRGIAAFEKRAARMI